MSTNSLQSTGTDLTLSTLAVGITHLARQPITTPQLTAWIELCLAKGLTTFDNADIYLDYTCEQTFGAVLRQQPALRTQMQLSTKCGIKLVSQRHPDHRIQHYDTSKTHILASVDQSLSNLQTDYLDLLLIHRPDPLMDFAETAEAFTELRANGKVRHFGVSNFLPSQFDTLESYLDFPLATNQVEFSVLGLAAIETGALDHCQRKGIPLMAWSPLSAGRLFRQETEQARRVYAMLQQVGDELGGVPVDQVALAWILRHPTRVVPITGATSVAQLESVCAATAIRLSRQQWFQIYAASRGFDVP